MTKNCTFTNAFINRFTSLNDIIIESRFINAGDIKNIVSTLPVAPESSFFNGPLFYSKRILERTSLYLEHYKQEQSSLIHISNSEISLSLFIAHKGLLQIREQDIKCGFKSVEGEEELHYSEVITRLKEWVYKEKKAHPLSYINISNQSLIEQISRQWSTFCASPKHLSSNYGEKYNLAFKLLAAELQNYFPLKNLLPNKVDRISTSGTFTSILMAGKEKGPGIKALIQSYWDKLNMPIFERLFQHTLLVEPDEIVAFIILAKRYNFYWFPFLTERLFKELENTPSVLWEGLKLYMLLGANCTIRQDKVYKIATCFVKDDVGRTEWQQGTFTLNSFKNKKRVFSSFKSTGFAPVKIDRDVHFAWEHTQLKILPNLWQYEVGELNKIDIEIGENSYSIPLVWRTFEVEIGALRLRFLLKKRRFQVSLKGHENLGRVKVNGMILSFNVSRYHKLYLTLSGNHSYMAYNFYSHSGREIAVKAIPQNFHYIYADGIVFNSIGILQTKARLSYNNSKKSLPISLNTATLNKIETGRPFSIACAKMEPVFYTPEKEKYIENIFKELAVEQFENTCLIHNKTNLSDVQISRLIYDKLKLSINCSSKHTLAGTNQLKVIEVLDSSKQVALESKKEKNFKKFQIGLDFLEGL